MARAGTSNGSFDAYAPTRRGLLGAGAAGAATAVLGGAAAAMPGHRRPNVLMVLCDEWRAQAFGHRGDVNAHTPAIDAFAATAISFENAVSPSPVCCIARASLLTGQYPQTHRVYINDVHLSPKTKTLGEAFADAGYATGYIGKWHLYGSPDGTYSRRNAYIPPSDRFGFRYWKAAECDHVYVHSHYYEGNDPTRRHWPGYDAIAQTEDAERYIAAHAGEDEPFYLTVSFGPPHFPYMAPAEYRSRWESRSLHFRPNVPPGLTEEATRGLRGYYAACEVLDDCFARLMKAVDASGVAEDTIVVFLSDHGEMGYSQGLIYKDMPWEESVRIPLLIRYPRWQRGRAGKSRAHIAMPDVMPTLLGAAAIPIPVGIEGVDYSRVLAGHAVPGAPRSAFLHMLASFGDMRTDGFAEYRGVRSDRHTYARTRQGPWLLYDNDVDPYQLHNLVGTPAADRLLPALERELAGWMRRRGDTFEPGSRYLKRDGLTHYLEARLPIGSVEGFNGQWRSTLREGDPYVLPSIPNARALLQASMTGSQPHA